MAQLAVQTTGLTGAAVTLAAATAGGDAFTNNGATRFRVNNGSGASITVIFTGQEKCNMGFTHDDDVTVAAGATEDIGPFSPGRFNDSTGSVQVTYSASASVTVGAYE